MVYKITSVGYVEAGSRYRYVGHKMIWLWDTLTGGCLNLLLLLVLLFNAESLI